MRNSTAIVQKGKKTSPNPPTEPTKLAHHFGNIAHAGIPSFSVAVCEIMVINIIMGGGGGGNLDLQNGLRNK